MVQHAAGRLLRSVDRRSDDVLDVSPDDSDATIEKTSRSRVKDFHPDRLDSKGLPEEMMRFAENRMKEFSLAYERITRAWNF